MDLSLDIRTEGSWTVVTVAGELDLHTSPRLLESVLSLLEDGKRRIAVEMAGVGFMDSSTLGVLVICLKRLREHDGDLVLVDLQPTPMKVLVLTGLDRVFTIVPTIDALP